jgi:hypothetical protein
MKLKNYIKKLQKFEEKYGGEIHVVTLEFYNYKSRYDSCPLPTVVTPKTHPRVRIY